MKNNVIKYYIEQRGNIKTGDLFFSTGNDPVSKFVMMFTRSKYSHNGMFVWEKDRLMIYEASTKGVRCMHFSKFIRGYNGSVDFYRFKKELSEPQKETIIGALKEGLGLKYSFFKSSFYIFLKALDKLKLLKNNEYKKKAYFCSEYISSALKKAGLDLCPEISEMVTTPEDLAGCEALQYQSTLKDFIEKTLYNKFKSTVFNRVTLPVFSFLKKIDYKYDFLLLNTFLSKKLTHAFANVLNLRPYTYTMYEAYKDQGPDSYTSWSMLTDNKYYGRYLQVANDNWLKNRLDDEDAVAKLFMLPDKTPQKTSDTSMLFMFFAQWFTDSLLRTDSENVLKTTSNHNINLCQIYGVNKSDTQILRLPESSKLRSDRSINNEEFPERLGCFPMGSEFSKCSECEKCYTQEELIPVLSEGESLSDVWRVKKKFSNLEYCKPRFDEKGSPLVDKDGNIREAQIYEILRKIELTNDEKAYLFATGLERGNSSVGYVTLSTLFLREHNRICDELIKLDEFNTDDHDRIFETARLINIALILKLTVEEYINHLASYKKFKFDPSDAENKKWYRAPWISAEFNLLYRWHGMVPEYYYESGDKKDFSELRFKNSLFETLSLGEIVTLSSTTNAGVIGLKNTPSFLKNAEIAMMKTSRKMKLRSYNEYRNVFGMDALNSIDELTSDETLKTEIKAIYNNINHVDLLVGLYAENKYSSSMFGELMLKMVGYDAFTQIYSNPLLSKKTFNSKTFTKTGWNIIQNTHSIEQLCRRNGLDGEDLAVSFKVKGKA